MGRFLSVRDCASYRIAGAAAGKGTLVAIEFAASQK
jgi:hypothetical protein